MVMGNAAIALGALQAGVNVVAGYPGTPSTEIVENCAMHRKETGVYVEWSINEKAAVEVAAGASYSGARTLVTMKQVGLNVASDPVMCLSYVGIKGGMVIVVADDPGPISSQTEQDTRTFGNYSKLPVFDPSSPEEAYSMMIAAFDYSEKYNTPVIVRPTTRVCHAYASMDIPALPKARSYDGFVKDTQRWVIFPRTSFANHKRIFARNTTTLPDDFSESRYNIYAELSNAADATETQKEGVATRRGIITGGISYEYTLEALQMLSDTHKKELDSISLLKIGTPYPFPEKLALQFLKDLDEVIAIEELDPVLEQELIFVCGKHHLSTKVLGKLTGDVQCAGENTVESVKTVLAKYMNVAQTGVKAQTQAEHNALDSDKPDLPIRPPVLCAGCPHRASFYAVKQAMKGKKTVFAGDIGCYTLGNAAPLDMTDTCLCMGADITMAQGFYHSDPERHCFSFIGDSTFFASGITGVVNAVYNQAKQTICVLDNSTTAMTGHQPHPGTGVTMMGDVVNKVSITKILEAVGVSPVITVDPMDLAASSQAVKEADEADGVSAVIFKSPCIYVASKLGYDAKKPFAVDSSKCIGCKKCITELGCPAIVFKDKKAFIETSQCVGCSICAQVCPVNAIGQEN